MRRDSTRSVTLDVVGIVGATWRGRVDGWIGWTFVTFGTARDLVIYVMLAELYSCAIDVDGVALIVKSERNRVCLKGIVRGRLFKEVT
jgi:hypothetical protein